MELLETSANPFKLHRQAKKILRQTSRANNPDWYKRANDLNLQWHIWIGVGRIISTIYVRAAEKWFEGPEMPQLAFERDEDTGEIISLDDMSRNSLHEMVRGILKNKEFGVKAKSLGIVMHLADGIRVRELAPDFAADDDFDNVNELLLSAPDIALGDDSVRPEDGVWRILPLFGKRDDNKRAVAVQVSGNFKFIADEFREYGEMRNIPVVAEVVSAALEGLAGLPELLPGATKFENTLSLLQFEAFTLLCATGAGGILEMVRPLSHRNDISLSPTEVADYVAQTAALLDLKAPRVMLVSMAGMEKEALENLLLVYKGMNPDAELHAIDTAQLPFAETVPGRRFEFAFSTGTCGIDVDEGTPIFEARKKWATQDFNGPSALELQKMPTCGDLRLLKFSGMAQKLAIVGLLAFGGWTGAEYFMKTKSEAWKLEESAVSASKLQFAKLQKERQNWEYYDNLFKERSEGWIAMQTLLGMFPEKGGILLQNANYAATSGATSAGADQYGIVRKWNISGYANPEMAKDLSEFGSKTKVAAIFDELAEETQSDYLSASKDSRSIEVKFDQKRGTMPSSTAFPTRVARYFRTAFDLSVTQSLDATDELALNINSSETE